MLEEDLNGNADTKWFYPWIIQVRKPPETIDTEESEYVLDSSSRFHVWSIVQRKQCSRKQKFVLVAFVNTPPNTT